VKETRTVVAILTPEGVPLRWNVARMGDRVAAFIIDCAAILGALVAVAMVAGAAGGGFGSWLGVLVQLAVFLLANFYFTFFELRWRGQTPGKRSVGIRVVDRHGGPLRPDAIFGRNFLRQVELFVPLGLILAPATLWPSAPGWARAASIVWAFVLALMPAWNRHRLRVGDLVAGTLVVDSPRVTLLPDVGVGPAADVSFTPEQLAVYGEYELQVLEQLLRDYDAGRASAAALHQVGAAIERKIGWTGGDVGVEKFLRAFYAAQRQRLERGLLFGRRKADKHAR
jgi:uncharacterized RDD family membrane protein YckC